jgi:hypothetical protein
MPLPYRSLHQTRENIVDWRAPNGAVVNGALPNGSAS